MKPLRMTGDLRRELILSAAKRCFSRYGFAGTTTKSVAAAAAISEGLLFKHFPTKSALYDEILAEACEADPALNHLLQLPPSTDTLVLLVRGMVSHFMDIPQRPEHQEAQRLRLLISSQLDDGEFARLVYGKVRDLVGPVFVASLNAATSCGDAAKVGTSPINLFWFAHHTVLMAMLAQMPAHPSLGYGPRPASERQMCEFILRGLGLTEAAIDARLDCDLPADLTQPLFSDAQPSESA